MSLAVVESVTIQIIMNLKQSDMTDKEYLDKALEFIVEREESNDYICEMLHRIPEESELCAKDCQNLDRFCVLRFLENYEKDE